MNRQKCARLVVIVALTVAGLVAVPTTAVNMLSEQTNRRVEFTVQ